MGPTNGPINRLSLTNEVSKSRKSLKDSLE